MDVWSLLCCQFYFISAKFFIILPTNFLLLFVVTFCFLKSIRPIFGRAITFLLIWLFEKRREPTTSSSFIYFSFLNFASWTFCRLFCCLPNINCAILMWNKFVILFRRSDWSSLLNFFIKLKNEVTILLFDYIKAAAFYWYFYDFLIDDINFYKGIKDWILFYFF